MRINEDYLDKVNVDDIEQDDEQLVEPEPLSREPLLDDYQYIVFWVCPNTKKKTIGPIEKEVRRVLRRIDIVFDNETKIQETSDTYVRMVNHVLNAQGIFGDYEHSREHMDIWHKVKDVGDWNKSPIVYSKSFNCQFDTVWQLFNFISNILNIVPEAKSKGQYVGRLIIATKDKTGNIIHEQFFGLVFEQSKQHILQELIHPSGIQNMNHHISNFSKIIKLFWPDELFERFVEWDKKITEKTGLQNPVGWDFTKNEMLSPTTCFNADDVSGIKVTDIDWKRVITDYIRNPHRHIYVVKTYSANYTGLPARAFHENLIWFTKQDKEKMMEYEPPYGIQFFFRNSGNIYNGDYDICCLIATIGLKENPNSLPNMPGVPRLMNICVVFTYCLHKYSLDSIINDEQRYTKDIMAFLDKYCTYEKTRDDVLVEDRLLGERFRGHHGY